MRQIILEGLILCGVSMMVGNPARVAAAGVVNHTDTVGWIEFVEDDFNDGLTDPGDPGKNDPGNNNQVDPGDPAGPDGGAHTTGDLRLVYVPNFDFGSHKIKYSPAGNVYYAKYQNITDIKSGKKKLRPSFFVVRDLRGEQTGWKVTLANDGKLTNTRDASDQLQIIFALQNLFVSNTEGFDISVIKLAHTRTNSYLELSSEDTVIVSAPEGKGVGTYNILLGTYANKYDDETNPGVKLFIPANQVISKAQYETTLKWSINDVV